jgi:hypothetical protein
VPLLARSYRTEGAVSALATPRKLLTPLFCIRSFVLLRRRQSVQDFEAQEISPERNSNDDFDELNDQFNSAHGYSRRTSSLGIPPLPQKAARGTLNFHVHAAIAWNVVWFAHANRLPRRGRDM